MIKFLYSTDWHAKPKSPKTRTDDYPSTIEAKITHFFRLGHELGVDAFLSSGDYFDTAFTPARYVTRIGKLIEKETKGKKLYGTWGNHDVTGWNPESVHNSPIGVYSAFSDSFVSLSEEPLKFTADNGESVWLSGINAYAQLDRHITDKVTGDILEHRARDYIVKNIDDLPRVHIVHGYLSPKPILDDIAHTVIEEMVETEAAITLTGHEHGGYPVTKTKQGWVYNPGALGRVHASHVEINRMPKYALCTVFPDGTSTIEPIPCSIAKPGEEVMDRSVLDEKKMKEAVLKEAKGNIRELLHGMNISNIDLNVIMAKYKDTTKPSVYEEARKRLGL